MSEQQVIRFLKNREIDYDKWDDCIQNAANSRVYATSWFLDRTAAEWNALVWGDYEFVMPLPYRKKFGISYLYQPLYCQQLGVFPAPSDDITMKFYNTLTRNFSYFDIQLNASNLPPKNFREIQPLPRKNFLLRLGTDYEVIYSGYSTNTKRNLAKASKNNLSFIESITIEEYIEFIQKNQSLEMPKNQLRKLKNIVVFAQYKGFGKIAGVFSAKNQLCATAFFCFWRNRVIYLNPVSSNEGKRLRAMFFLIDKVIERNSRKSLKIDFEGSMVTGIARFFEGFGAAHETYYRMRFNQLPVLFRWIKRDSE